MVVVREAVPRGDDRRRRDCHFCPRPRWNVITARAPSFPRPIAPRRAAPPARSGAGRPYQRCHAMRRVSPAVGTSTVSSRVTSGWETIHRFAGGVEVLTLQPRGQLRSREFPSTSVHRCRSPTQGTSERAGFGWRLAILTDRTVTGTPARDAFCERQRLIARSAVRHRCLLPGSSPCRRTRLAEADSAFRPLPRSASVGRRKFPVFSIRRVSLLGAVSGWIPPRDSMTGQHRGWDISSAAPPFRPEKHYRLRTAETVFVAVARACAEA